MTILRVFHFGIVFWGDKFRDVFTDLCLLSLLSERNIPTLENGGGNNRFLICTTQADWAALQQNTTFRLMRDYIEPEFVEMTDPGPAADKMVIMSEGHRMIADIMFERRVYGVFIYPDTVFSDGAVAALQTHARAGKMAVLANCPRLANEGFLEELAASGLMRPGHPAPLPARDLVSMALRHIHSETRRYEWARPYFAELPVCPYWRVPGEDGIVMHSFIWAPVMLDYNAVREHATGTLDGWTIDGDYVDQNFGVQEDKAIHVVTDSDEMMLVSFTPEADLHIPMTPNWVKRVPGVGTLMKLALVHDLYHGPAIDPLKRRIFGWSVHIHGAELNRKSVATARRAAFRIGIATRDRGGIAGAIAIAVGRLIAEIAEPSRRLYYRQRLNAAIGNMRAVGVRLREMMTAKYLHYVFSWLYGTIVVARVRQLRWIVTNRDLLIRRVSEYLRLRERN